MAADKPDQVTEIRDGRLISDVVQHVLVVHCREQGEEEEELLRHTHSHAYTPGELQSSIIR